MAGAPPDLENIRHSERRRRLSWAAIQMGLEWADAAAGVCDLAQQQVTVHQLASDTLVLGPVVLPADTYVPAETVEGT